MKKGKETKTKTRTKKETKIKLDEYVEDEEQDEFEDSYEEDAEDTYSFDELEEIEDDDYEEQKTKKLKTKSKPKKKKSSNNINYKKIINIVFVVIMILLIIITIDVIAVGRYDNGPFFAIQTKKYDDGGTKEYYGLGYKVIKYNQTEGRKGMTIGFWNLQYSTEPTPIDIIDLALEFENDYEKVSNKFYNEYLKVTGTIREVDLENKQIIMEYNDIDGKYTLEVVANVTDEVIISSFNAADNVNVYGIAKKFSAKTTDTPNTITFDSCFVELTTE